MRILRRSLCSLVSVSSLCILVAILSPSARAQGDASAPKCTFSVSNISFGTVDVKNGRPYDATGTLTYACTGDSREIVRICPSLGLAGNGTRFMTDAAGDKLVFNLYSDTSRITVWGTWYGKIKAPSIEVPIGRSQTGGGTATIYARLDPNQQTVAAGVYNSAINGSNSAFAYNYASKGSCDAIKSGDRVSVPVSVTARVSDGGPSAQPIVAPDATHTTDPGSNNVTNPPTPEKRSLWQKLADNAQYQQQKNQGNAPSQSGPKPLCKMSDSDVHLVDGNWSGPNCIAVNADGKPVHPEEVQQQTDSEQTQRSAEYIESHSCMTTMGADKANQLADQCAKATTGSHPGCNIQQNTCDEIRDATRHGCDRLGASAPDFCLTK
jgi:spore coat protein U-like protein